MELSVWICKTPWDERGSYQVTATYGQFNSSACKYEFSCEHSPETLFLLGWECEIVAAVFSAYLHLDLRTSYFFSYLLSFVSLNLLLLFCFAAEMHGNEEYHPCKTEGDAQLLGEGKTADPPHPRHRPFKTHKL